MHSASQASSGVSTRKEKSYSGGGGKMDNKDSKEDNVRVRIPAPNSKSFPDMIEVMELVGTNPEKKNWKGIIIAVLVILMVFALITVAVIIVSPDKEDKKIGVTFTFEDMFNPDFIPKKFDGKWMKGRDAFIYRSREGEIIEYDTTNHSSRRLMDNSTFRRCDTETYFVSPDLRYVLIAHKIEPVFRHSFLAEYQIYDRDSNDPATRLMPFPTSTNGNWENKKLQFAGWSKTGSSLSFVYENNLYYQSSPTSTPTRLTDSGSPTVYNGVPDWLYEEEILHTHVSHWWSEDSTYICYTQIDDTQVPSYTFPWYGEQASMYGSFMNVAYPKAGESRENINPVIQLYVFNTKSMTSSHQLIQTPARLKDREHYITKVVWQNDGILLVVWSYRAQNHSIITLCDPQGGQCFESMEEASTGGWVTIDPILFIEDGAYYVTLLPAMEGGKGYFKHIAMVKATVGQRGARSYITQGASEVMGILGYRQETKTIYYLGTNGDPKARHIFSVAIEQNAEALPEPECLTCDMGEGCQYVGGSFSQSGQYYILHCQGPGVPQYILKSIVDLRFNKMLEDNKYLSSKIRDIALPVEEFIQIKTPQGHKLEAKLYLPPLLNTKHITMYPLLINTYAGPGSQLVTYKFKLDWETYLASAHNVIYAVVDGRGTAGRGDAWLHQLYKRLGTVEVQDQLHAARYIRDKYAFVDKDRIGIWGWSYGGFVTAHALGDEYNDVFSCGISVAPVTDFRYYDTAYTERYLGLADIENVAGYEASNVSSKAQNFQSRQYMIVHGTADDNVHFQNTAQFIRALTDAEVDFRVQVYTDKKHALSGTQTKRHLYRTMTNFIRKTCWQGANPREKNSKGEFVDVDLQLLAIR